MVKLSVISQREVGDTLLDRSRLVKNAAVLRFFCARRAERIKYRRFSKSCKVSSLSQADRAMTQGKEVYMLVHNSSLFPETIHRKKVRSLRPENVFWK